MTRDTQDRCEVRRARDGFRVIAQTGGRKIATIVMVMASWSSWSSLFLFACYKIFRLALLIPPCSSR